MSEVKKLNNIIKFDSSKCTGCHNCIKVCKTRALSFLDGVIEFYKDNCILCRECINECPTHSLYYSINDDADKSGNVAVVPYNVDINFIKNKYKTIKTLELGEKVKVIETAFEMEQLTSKKINKEPITFHIISDYFNLGRVLKNKYPNLYNHLSKVKDEYYLTSYLTRLESNDKSIHISAYGVPFECKLNFDSIKIIDEIYDLPYNSKFKYNPFDILNTYKESCKFNSDIKLNEVMIKDKQEIKFYNKYISVNILLVNGIENLDLINYTNYDFIFILKHSNYTINDNLLKDEEANNLYQRKLKGPGKIKAFFRKD